MESLNEIFAWLNDHPGWGGAVVFLIAFFESLAMVGLVLPGAAMMFGIGALVGTGILPLGPTLVWAAIGAIAGDGVSFWLGRHYHMQLKTLWPLRKHPELIARATQFFYRHGGKSILFGRFIGPIRPVIPAVAGMLEMPTRRFLAFNIISGILWAPVYVLPGMIFTTSLGLAAEVTSRLAVMMGSVLAVLVFVLWFSRLGFNWLHRQTYPLIQRLLWWSKLHPVAGRIPASLLDPTHPEARGLTLLAIIVLAATLLFTTVLVTLAKGGGMLAGLDHSLHQALHYLRTPSIDSTAIFFKQFGKVEILFGLSAGVLVWLWSQGLRRAAIHWLSALGFSALLGLALYGTGVQLDTPALTRHAQSNALLLGAIACYGFLAVLIARELPLRHRWWIYTLSTLLLLAIAVAQLYLGTLHFGAMLGILALGIASVSLLGIGYRHHPGKRIEPLKLSLLATAVIAVVLGWQLPKQFEMERQQLSRTEPPVTITSGQWQSGELSMLPRYRADLHGKQDHPLNIHYLGDLKALEQTLLQAGWQHPPSVDMLSWMRWLNPDLALEEMPVLPQVHDGRYHDLLLTMKNSNEQIALRLWRSAYLVGEKAEVLWLGSISELGLITRGVLTVPRTRLSYEKALEVFIKALPDNLNISREQGETTVGRITLNQ